MRLLASLLSRRLFASGAAPPVDPAKLLIAYGSQTGTAQSFAELLGASCVAKGVPCEVRDVGELPHPSELKRAQKMVFILSNYGEGQPPDHARDFCEYWYKQQHPAGELENLQFALFGLGNSVNFPERYQAIGIRMFDCFTSLGAHPFVERGEGDDADDIEGDFELWEEKFWGKYQALQGKEGGAVPDVKGASVSPTAKAGSNLEILSSTPELLQRTTESRFPLSDNSGKDAKNPSPCKILKKENLLEEGTLGYVSHIEAQILRDPATGRPVFTYETGDHIGIFPCSFAPDVERTLAALGVDGNVCFRLRKPSEITGKAEDDASINRLRGALYEGCSLRYALTNILDVNTVSKPILRLLISHAAAGSASHRALSSMDENYAEEVKRQFLILPDLLERFNDVQVPWEQLVDILQPLQPRFYSLSSSSTMYPDQAHVTVNQIFNPSNDGKSRFQGLCSTFCKTLQTGDTIHMSVRPSHFRLPTDPNLPIVMVAGGSGIAPFIGLLQELETRGSVDHAEVYLFFGVRSPKYELYRDQLKQFLAAGVLTQYHVAYSDQCPAEHHEGTMMLAPKIQQFREELKGALVQRPGHMLVCGGASAFVQSIRDCFADILGGQAQLELAMKQGTYVEDCA